MKPRSSPDELPGTRATHGASVNRGTRTPCPDSARLFAALFCDKMPSRSGSDDGVRHQAMSPPTGRSANKDRSTAATSTCVLTPPADVPRAGHAEPPSGSACATGAPDAVRLPPRHVLGLRPWPRPSPVGGQAPKASGAHAPALLRFSHHLRTRHPAARLPDPRPLGELGSRPGYKGPVCETVACA